MLVAAAAGLAAMTLERAFGALAFGARLALGRGADSMGDPVSRGVRLFLLTPALFAGAAEIDDLAQAGAPLHFLRKASIETTFAASGSAGGSPFFADASADLGFVAVAAVG